MGTRLSVIGMCIIVLGIGWVLLGPRDDDIQNYAPPTIVSGIVVLCTGLIIQRIDRKS